MNTTKLAKIDEQEYDLFVHAHPHSSFEHTRRWGMILHHNFGFIPLTLVHKNIAGKIDGVLNLFEARSLFGTRLVSTPYAVSTGILAENQAVETALLSSAREFAQQKKVSFLEVRETIPKKSYDQHFKCSQNVYNFSLALSSDPQTIWSKLPKSSVRWGIKTAEKSGMTWTRGNASQDLKRFYHLFLITRKFRGVPGYPYRYFEQILAEFGDSAQIYTAFFNGKPIASIFLLYHRQEVRYAFGGSLQVKSVLKLQPYHLLFWEAIKDGCKKGYSVFNLGGATKDTNEGGLYEFKRKWADHIVPIPSYFYFHKARKPFPSESLLFKMASRVWKNLPLIVIDRLSPYLIRQFV